MQRNLYTYTYVHVPYDEVERRLRGDPMALLQEATHSAGDRADTLTAHLRVDVGAFQLGRDAAVELGALRDVDPHCVSLPIRWQAEDGHGVFPAMEGFLEAAQLASNPPVTQLSFIGHYRPPLGFLGAVGDAGLGRRVAEMAVHHFLMDAADRIGTVVGVASPNGT